MSSPLWEDVDRFLTITSANSARARLGYRPLRPIARSATGRGAVADGYERDEELSAEVLTYVGFDRDSAVPGRHLDRIADGQLRSRVKALISEVDSLPDGGSQDLFAWAEQRLGAIAEAHPELTDDALIALRALLSFEWH